MAQWGSLQELGSARGLAFLFWVQRHLGRLPFRLLLYPVLLWFFLFKPTPRRASKEFLGRALMRPATWRMSLRHFGSFAEALLDKLVAWNGGFALSDVEFHGRDAVEARLAKKEGLILIGSHLGNLEICRVLSKWRPGLELHVLVHTRHAENFNRVLKKLDPSSQLNLHQVSGVDSSLAAWMSERVSQGAVLLIAGDRVPLRSGKTTTALFFGAPAPFAQGPWVLAHALGCPVHLLFCLRQGRGFEVDFEPFEERVSLPRGASRDAALQSLVSRYASRLEARAAKNPYQWFNFYPFWEKTTP
jgi:predicted LPLAT superfamily acyltransferase